MDVLRAATVIGLAATFASGCLIGFDSHRLTGGDASGSGNQTPPMTNADTVGDMATGCDELSRYMPGDALSNWVVGTGSWRIVMMTQGKVLIQTTDAMGRDNRFVAWRSGRDIADTTVSAVALLDGMMTDLNCVLARVTDANNYYGLCIADVGGKNKPTTRQWSLVRSVGGTETRLAGATIPTMASHALSLTVQGTTLTGTVDGVVQPAISDVALTHGSVGVSTDEGGGFFNLCTGLP